MSNCVERFFLQLSKKHCIIFLQWIGNNFMEVIKNKIYTKVDANRKDFRKGNY